MRRSDDIRHILHPLILVTALAAAGCLAPVGALAQDVEAEIVEEPGVDLGSEQGLQEWVKGFRGRALAQGISAATFDAAMAGVHFLPDVVQRDRKQDEFTKTIWDYLD